MRNKQKSSVDNLAAFHENHSVVVIALFVSDPKQESTVLYILSRF